MLLIFIILIFQMIFVRKFFSEDIVLKKEKKLLKKRVIFLGTVIDSNTANRIIRYIKFLNTMNAGNPIYIYINSPGGIIEETIRIIDAINRSESPVSTMCIGECSGSAVWILAYGNKGKRFSFAEAEIGFVPYIKYYEEINNDNTEKFDEILIRQTSISKSQLKKFRAEKIRIKAPDAIKYGIIDLVIEQI